MEGVLVIKNVSVKLFSFIQWREYCVIKNVSVKLFSFFNGGSIGDQELACQTLQLHQWRGVLVIKKRVCQTLQLLQCSGYW